MQSLRKKCALPAGEPLKIRKAVLSRVRVCSVRCVRFITELTEPVGYRRYGGRTETLSRNRVFLRGYTRIPGESKDSIQVLQTCRVWVSEAHRTQRTCGERVIPVSGSTVKVHNFFWGSALSELPGDKNLGLSVQPQKSFGLNMNSAPPPYVKSLPGKYPRCIKKSYPTEDKLEKMD